MEKNSTGVWLSCERALEHEQLSGAVLTAVKGDVLVASVRVKTSNAFLIGKERRHSGVRIGQVTRRIWAGNGIQDPEDLNWEIRIKNITQQSWHHHHPSNSQSLHLHKKKNTIQIWRSFLPSQPSSPPVCCRVQTLSCSSRSCCCSCLCFPAGAS